MKTINIDETLKYLNKTIENKELCGISLSVVTKDNYKDYYLGNTSYANNIKINPNHIYDLASLSKVVSTTTLILKCIENGLITLNTKVSEIFEDFPYKNITIMNLLTHTSGYYPDDKNYKKYHGEQEFKDFIFNMDLLYETNTKVEYSDFGFILLGFILKKLTNKNIDELSKEWIFEKLGMNNTTYIPHIYNKINDCIPTEQTEDRGLIQGYVHDGKAFRLDGLSGNAGLFSNAIDLSKFVMMMLNEGKYNNKQVLSKNSINLLKKSYTTHLNNKRTLGWLMDDPTCSFGDYYSDLCLYHTGFSGTSIYIDFRREMGIILLTNRIHPTRNNNNIFHIRNITHNLILKSFDE